MNKTPARPPIVPVILCGGAGVRLWPLSRESRPKQFLPLVGGRSTFAMTLERVGDRRMFAPPLIVASAEHRHLVADELRSAGTEAEILLEPVRRDSAAAVAVAATLVARRDEAALLLVLAADHVIRDGDGFKKSVEAARCAAEADRIVTFGISPTEPATGFGYIGRGAPLPACAGVSAVAVFAEKPDAATAARYISEGYLWNSGNFMMRAACAVAELRRLAPDIAAGAEGAVADIVSTGGFLRLPLDRYRTIPATSFDYALMEKTGLAAVVEAGFDWHDLGSWDALAEINGRDAAGNSTTGNVVIRDSRGSYVDSAKGLVAVLGVDNLVVAVGEGAVMVAARDRLGAIKEFVGEIGRQARQGEGEAARTILPWGYFEVIGGGAGYKVKRIVVDCGARLSLQRHRHRAEHWVVVAGVADVIVGDDASRLETNQAVFVPSAAVHRLGNSGDLPLIVIEVQYGDYLGEDDIERLADDYDRGTAPAR